MAPSFGTDILPPSPVENPPAQSSVNNPLNGFSTWQYNWVITMHTSTADACLPVSLSAAQAQSAKVGGTLGNTQGIVIANTLIDTRVMVNNFTVQSIAFGPDGATGTAIGGQCELFEPFGVSLLQRFHQWQMDKRLLVLTGAVFSARCYFTGVTPSGTYDHVSGYTGDGGAYNESKPFVFTPYDISIDFSPSGVTYGIEFAPLFGGSTDYITGKVRRSANYARPIEEAKKGSVESLVGEVREAATKVLDEMRAVKIVQGETFQQVVDLYTEFLNEQAQPHEGQVHAVAVEAVEKLRAAKASEEVPDMSVAEKVSRIQFKVEIVENAEAGFTKDMIMDSRYNVPIQLPYGPPVPGLPAISTAIDADHKVNLIKIAGMNKAFAEKCSAYQPESKDRTDVAYRVVVDSGHTIENGEILTTFTIRAVKSPMVKDYTQLPADGDGGVMLEYDYLYPTRYSDLLSMTMSLNYATFGVMAENYRNEATSDKNLSPVAHGPATVANANTADGTKPSTLEPHIDTKGYNAEYPQTQSAFLSSLSLAAAMAASEMSIEVVGDPYVFWDSIGLPSNVTKSADKGSGHYHVGSIGGEPWRAKINVKYPVHDQESDTYIITPFWYQSYYHLIMVDSNFRNGNFTQTLHLMWPGATTVGNKSGVEPEE